METQFKYARMAMDRVDSLYEKFNHDNDLNQLIPEDQAIITNPQMYLAMMFRMDEWWADDVAKIICAMTEKKE